tara:strand:+ start:1240 stop:1650 length:411 start_codon:yes stop_codon:yes gene_type:complete
MFLKDYDVNRSQFSFFTEINTRWRDLDAFNHINHAMYLTYLETGRFDFLNDIKELKKSLIMASISIDYHKQGYHPSKLFIGQKIVSIGNTSFKMLASVFNNEEDLPLVSSLTVLVCFDFKKQKSFPVPEIIRNKIN